MDNYQNLFRKINSLFALCRGLDMVISQDAQKFFNPQYFNIDKSRNFMLTVGKNARSSKPNNRDPVNFFGFMDVSYGIN